MIMNQTYTKCTWAFEGKRPNRARTTDISASFLWIADLRLKAKRGGLWSYLLLPFFTCVNTPLPLGKHFWLPGLVLQHHNLKLGFLNLVAHQNFLESIEKYIYRFLAVTLRYSVSVVLAGDPESSPGYSDVWPRVENTALSLTHTSLKRVLVTSN